MQIRVQPVAVQLESLPKGFRYCNKHLRFEKNYPSTGAVFAQDLNTLNSSGIPYELSRPTDSSEVSETG
jgi:hypothetical protein